MTGQNRTDGNPLNASFCNPFCIHICEHFILRNHQFTRCRIPQIFCQIPTNQTFCQRFNQFTSVANLINFQTFCCTAVLFPNDNILGNINQTTGQVTRVSSTQCGICQTLSSTSGRDKVFQDVQTLSVIGTNRHLNGRTRCVGNQTTHTSQLTNLTDTTTGTRVRHHEDGVITIQTTLQCLGNVFRCTIPDLDKPLGLLCSGDITICILCIDICNLCISLCNNILLFFRDNGITNRNSNGCLSRVFKASCLNFIQYFRSCCRAVNLNAAIDNLTKLLLANQKCNFQIKLMLRIRTIHIA